MRASVNNEDMYCDLSQTCTYAKGLTNRIGCLLTKSSGWSHRLARPLLPREALELMGLPVFPSTVQTVGWQSPWMDGLDSTPEPVLQRIAGNGLHMACVLATLVWALADQTEVA